MTQFKITEITKFSGQLNGLEIFGQKIVLAREDKQGRKIFIYNKNKVVEIKNTKGAFPQVSGDNMVWAAKDSDGDQEIFFYDGKETIQLTDNDVNDTFPQISGDNIVWGWDSVLGLDSIYSREIFLYNGQDIIQLTDNNQSNTFPQISGNNVVWSGIDSNNKRQIFFFDGQETIQIPNKKHRKISQIQKVSKDQVILTIDSERSSYSKLFIDRSKETIRLTRFLPPLWDSDFDWDSQDDYNPRISGRNIVWETKGNLFFYNGRETTQLDDQNKDVKGSSIQISGKNIVWTAKDLDGDQEIYFYNGEKTIQLTDNNVNDYSPQISGENLVWVSGDDAFSREILFYNGSETIQLTNNHELSKVSPKIDWNPKIAGNNIVWKRDNVIDNTTSVLLAIINNTESWSNPSSDRNDKIVTSSTIIILGLVLLCWLKKLQLKCLMINGK
ncbi:MAG: hypothetical protein AAF383_29335 [Cyanobacteria bacterium P01_A01_bin.83]